jgi:membrane protease YdiL (CAAX protease family)
VSEIAGRHRVIRAEILLVLALSLGASAAYSIVSFIAKLTAEAPLSSQTTALNPSQSARPWLDLTYQLLGIAVGVVPALLCVHLLRRDRDDALPALGLDGRRPGFDLAWGAVLAAAIGIPGLGLYVVAKAAGVNTTVAAANLPDIWWAVPVLILAAAQNAVLEEVVMVGYLMTRLRELGWGTAQAVAFSSLLRGSYHVYQGVGGFVGNAVMGVVLCAFFLRTRRLWPLIIAHLILDVVAYLGYTALADRVSWL